VADLIDPHTRNWNYFLLTDLFDSESVQQIQKIHVPQLVSSDRWNWVPASSGQFSVRSAHEVVSQITTSRLSPLSSKDWNCLWGLKIQHRLKHLLWKIAWNILPVRANIGRFIHSEDHSAWQCPFCKGPQETISHLFLECSFARILWRSSSWPINTDAFCNQPISEWIAAILNPSQVLAVPSLDSRKFQLHAAITLDHIWFVRNHLVHNDVQPGFFNQSKKFQEP
jgi:hypothetical protein